MTFQKNVNGIEYIYEESFWTGKKKLSMNGVALTPVSKGVFSYLDQSGTNRQITIKGSFLNGITLNYEGGSVTLVKNTWYDWILIILPLLSIIFGVLNGLIGGGLSALFSFLAAVINATILRSKLNLALKVVFTLLITAVMTFAWILIVALIIGGIQAMLS